jgi:tetratricopeptide (TPR) repeat protein
MPTRAACFAGLSLALTLWTAPATAIDLTPLWDFSRPEVSEQRFKAALENATGDDALILRTQIARTYGLRKDFDTARQQLLEMAPATQTAGPEAKVRYHLELGRTYASATHPKDRLSEEAKAQARQSYGRALELARTARLDDLAIDAIHMFAFVDTAPADQLKWGQAALDVALASQQPEARRWEASIRNNVGYALHQLGRYDEALVQFQEALAIRERGTNAQATHVARWMVAWTLRSLSRNDEALQMQLALEKAADAAGKPDEYVFEELEALYRAAGDLRKAEHYADLKTAARRR